MGRRSKSWGSWIGWLACLAGFSVLGPMMVWAEDDPQGAEESSPPSQDTLRVPSSPSGAGRVDAPELESLLQLPSGFRSSADAPAVAGANETEWRRRFRKSQRELADAQASLAKTKVELDKVAGEGGGSSWNVAPNVGGGGTPQGDAPLSFKLRQQLKSDRELVEAAEKAMRQLRIEADLAGVPAAWREEATPVPSSARQELPAQ